MNRKCCKKAVTSTCPTGHLTGPACSSTGTCSSKGYDCMKDINMCCLKLQVISPCLSRLSDGSCKTDTDCKSGYTCKIGTCCKTPVLTPSSCPSFLSAGSCKTDTDCKSGYTCNIGTCCKTLVLPPSTCLSFLSAGSCETDTDCESSYKCESGTCCRSFVAPPSCPRGTYSSGTCAGGRKCDGDCINNLCCKSYTRPSFSEYTKQVSHYANTPMQYTAIFHGCKNVHFQMIFLIFCLFLLKTLIVGTR